MSSERRVGRASGRRWIAVVAGLALRASCLATASPLVGADATVHGCVGIRSGKLRVVRPGVACKRGYQAVSWGVTTGVTEGPRAYGVVTAGGYTGPSATSKNLVSVDHVMGSGQYCVHLAAGIDPTNATLLATPVMDLTPTAPVLRTSYGLNCPGGFAVRTSSLSVINPEPVCDDHGCRGGPYLKESAADAGFTFVVP